MLDELDPYSPEQRRLSVEQAFASVRKAQQRMERVAQATSAKAKYWVYFPSTCRWVQATKIGYDLAQALGRPVARGERRPSHKPKGVNLDVQS